jgi:sigma-B regulation protein RsbU (phosphoserine phosphatase)
MLTKAIQLLIAEYRTRRLARFTAWVLAYGAALWGANRITRAAGGVPGLLWFVFWVCALVSGAYYLVRLLKFVRYHLLWRLRRRLVVTYVFIGFIPILLILTLAVLGAYIINCQFAAYLVVMKLREHFDEIKQVNRVVEHEARFAGSAAPQVVLDRIRNFYVTELIHHAESYPGLEITLNLGGVTHAFHLDGTPATKPVTLPKWLTGEEFAGIVADNGQIALRSVDRVQTPQGELTLVLSQPFTPELLDMVGESIGPVGVVMTKPKAENPGEPRGVTVSTGSGVSIRTEQGLYVQSIAINSKSLKVSEPLFFFDFTVYGASTLDPVLWGGERQEKATAPAIVYVSSRISALNNRLLAMLGDFSWVYVFVFKTLVIIFVVIEGVALLIGVRMTRSITSTVDKLYDATERVKAGDLSYRIHTPPRDQLTALGGAFDSMTVSVQRLMQESEERMRLQSELEIAREVQNRLFPESAPRVPGLELYGVCKAARSVSGDYYDFLELDENRVGLVLGDVSGKGISAALLMAAIQSALRAQFYDGAGGKEGLPPPRLLPAQVVERLNRQLYASTPLEKYVTFFFAIYEATTRQLSYTNAGHLPPLLFRGDRLERLRTGGTVVGLFPGMTYEVGEVQLERGDLLVAYTDGLTEPENIYGEEFGEGRLLEVLRRARNASPEALTAEVYRTVEEWTGSPELQDDMTMVLARAVA